MSREKNCSPGHTDTVQNIDSAEGSPLSKLKEIHLDMSSPLDDSVHALLSSLAGRLPAGATPLELFSLKIGDYSISRSALRGIRDNYDDSFWPIMRAFGPFISGRFALTLRQPASSQWNLAEVCPRARMIHIEGLPASDQGSELSLVDLPLSAEELRISYNKLVYQREVVDLCTQRVTELKAKDPGALHRVEVNADCSVNEGLQNRLVQLRKDLCASNGIQVTFTVNCDHPSRESFELAIQGSRMVRFRLPVSSLAAIADCF